MMSRITIDGHPFDVEWARTDAEKARGLMHRKQMDNDKGMIFVFTPPTQTVFWMKNTHIPLDMVYADEQGNVLGIHKNAVPMSEKRIFSPDNTMYVIEINGGLSDKLNIKKGSKVEF